MKLFHKPRTETVEATKMLSPLEGTLRLSIYEYAVRRGVSDVEAPGVADQVITTIITTRPVDFDDLLVALDSAVAAATGSI